MQKLWKESRMFYLRSEGLRFLVWSSFFFRWCLSTSYADCTIFLSHCIDFITVVHRKLWQFSQQHLNGFQSFWWWFLIFQHLEWVFDSQMSIVSIFMCFMAHQMELMIQVALFVFSHWHSLGIGNGNDNWPGTRKSGHVNSSCLL